MVHPSCQISTLRHDPVDRLVYTNRYMTSLARYARVALHQEEASGSGFYPNGAQSRNPMTIITPQNELSRFALAWFAGQRTTTDCEARIPSAPCGENPSHTITEGPGSAAAHKRHQTAMGSRGGGALPLPQQASFAMQVRQSYSRAGLVPSGELLSRARGQKIVASLPVRRLESAERRTGYRGGD
ncbi:hypothetical protein NLG97_g7330 [Lecanicillium saksenae]|uniref:Uncharacterized protein n=1 Tax=Lecanicillium saksenae TaxID=468837 RepID=A0ACC1QM36_9HYPO|nr:hypothetical protein NLG97_g7330 [Lecanicillium saksenae]